MKYRTSKVNNQQTEQLQEIIKKVEQRAPHFRNMTMSPSGANRMSLAEIKDLAKNPMPYSILPAVNKFSRSLVDLNLTFLNTDDKIGFITSDAPCICCFPKYKNEKGILTMDVEITFPITPHQTLLLSNVENQLYTKTPVQNVDELNRRIRLNCERIFFVQSNTTNPAWFTIPINGTPK